MNLREQIIDLLGCGIPATQVASAVGCTPSWISQLLEDPEVERQVTEKKAARLANYASVDREIDTAEEQALAKVKALVPFITRPAEAVRVFGILNAAKRRAVQDLQGAQSLAPTVVLDLPEIARVTFTATPDKQVIEIEGRAMATMPARVLAKQLEQKQAARLLETKAPQFLLSTEAAKL